MSWTAITSGADYAVGEVVTASKLNTHVGDNLRFLHGDDGTINLIADLGVGTTNPLTNITASTYGRAIGVSTANSNENNALIAEGHRSGSDAGFAHFVGINRAATGTDKRAGILAFLRDTDDNSGQVAIATRNAGTTSNKVFIKKDGKVGINQSTPQGFLHGYDGTTGGFLFWSNAAVSGTVITVIPDGTGDVTAILGGYYTTACNDGTIQSGAFANSGASGSVGMTPGGSAFTIGNNSTAAQNCRITVNADGSVQVQRTAGASATWKVVLWLLWI